MNDENLSLEEVSEDSTQDTGSENQGAEQENQGISGDNPQETTQEPSNQNKISEQIATLKKALEYLESQNEQGFNQEIEIAKLQEILRQIEQLRHEIFIKQEQKLEESEAYFSLVGVKVALLEKLKAQNEC